VIVPARDEERDVGATLADLAAQDYPALEIVVVDDCSGDGTRAAIARAAAHEPRIVPVDGEPPPPGWLGKPWACEQGVRRASGEWLLFTDADVRFEPGAVAAALGFARVAGGGGCTLAPRLVCETFWERVVQPAAAMVIASFVAPPLLSQRPGSRVAMAAGGFILVERDLYARAGGHGAVRDRVADDLQLARAVKRAGGLLALGYGDRLLRVRMYHGHAELWRGWRKNAAYGLPGGPLVAAVGATLLLAGTLAPPAALVAGLRRGDGRLAGWGAGGLAALLGLRLAGQPFAPTPLVYVAAAPLGLLWLVAVTAVAAVDRATGGARWRGRRYAHAR
jgi:glycosyltransferase involved in cell wall biosynthesis